MEIINFTWTKVEIAHLIGKILETLLNNFKGSDKENVLFINSLFQKTNYVVCF